jgi:hypothetical protein
LSRGFLTIVTASNKILVRHSSRFVGVLALT